MRGNEDDVVAGIRPSGARHQPTTTGREPSNPIRRGMGPAIVQPMLAHRVAGDEILRGDAEAGCGREGFLKGPGVFGRRDVGCQQRRVMRHPALRELAAAVVATDHGAPNRPSRL